MAEERCNMMILPSPSHCRAKAMDHDRDRKSTRLNSSHSQISYAVLCLKKHRAAPCRRGARAQPLATVDPLALWRAVRDSPASSCSFFRRDGPLRHLHSFPTRRSSDLPPCPAVAEGVATMI